MEKVIGIIPARLESTRLPRKLLREINGKPLIQYVWEQGNKSKLDEIIIATDSYEILEVCEKFGAVVKLTSADHRSGTGRVAELAQEQKADLYINLQGDEPLIHPDTINTMIDEFFNSYNVDVITIANNKISLADYHDPNVVKVIVNGRNEAVYFSRAPIPYYRNTNIEEANLSYKHIGLYGYTLSALNFYIKSKPGLLEDAESLEQLRFLENGYRIKVAFSDYGSSSVDTLEDFEKVRRIIADQSSGGNFNGV